MILQVTTFGPLSGKEGRKASMVVSAQIGDNKATQHFEVHLWGPVVNCQIGGNSTGSTMVLHCDKDLAPPKSPGKS